MIVLQGYGATETAAGCATTMADHPLGCVGWPPPPVEMRMADDGEIQFRGPTLFKGYWHNPEATAAAFTDDGWYKSGDLGQLDAKGRLHLHGRKKDIIVLPNGFNVYPEDLENALRVAGVRDSVALETRPGRIEAIVLGPGGGPAASADTPAPELTDEARATIDAAVKAANQALGPNQRITGWRLWPGADFPRTHTLKVKRDKVRAWATDEAPLPVTEGATASGVTPRRRCRRAVRGDRRGRRRPRHRPALGLPGHARLRPADHGPLRPAGPRRPAAVARVLGRLLRASRRHDRAHVDRPLRRGGHGRHRPGWHRRPRRVRPRGAGGDLRPAGQDVRGIRHELPRRRGGPDPVGSAQPRRHGRRRLPRARAGDGAAALRRHRDRGCRRDQRPRPIPHRERSPRRVQRLPRGRARTSRA